jgi:hypothetical protein
MPTRVISDFGSGPHRRPSRISRTSTLRRL